MEQLIYINASDVFKFVGQYKFITNNEKLLAITKHNLWLSELIKPTSNSLQDLILGLNNQDFNIIKNIVTENKQKIIKNENLIIEKNQIQINEENNLEENNLEEQSINNESKKVDNSTPSENKGEETKILDKKESENLDKDKTEISIIDKLNLILEIKKSIKETIKETNETDSYIKLIEMVPMKPIQNALKKDIYTLKGIHEETHDIQKFIQKQKVNVQKNTRFYKKKLLTFKYKDITINVLIGGYIDGQINETTILESKHRINKLYDRIPDYELIQMEMYFFLIDKVDTCIHLQTYKKTSISKTYKHNKILLYYIQKQLQSYIEDLLNTYYIKK